MKAKLETINITEDIDFSKVQLVRHIEDYRYTILTSGFDDNTKLFSGIIMQLGNVNWKFSKKFIKNEFVKLSPNQKIILQND